MKEIIWAIRVPPGGEKKEAPAIEWSAPDIQKGRGWTCLIQARHQGRRWAIRCCSGSGDSGYYQEPVRLLSCFYD